MEKMLMDWAGVERTFDNGELLAWVLALTLGTTLWNLFWRRKLKPTLKKYVRRYNRYNKGAEIERREYTRGGYGG